jgi:hypothetical protein
MSTLPLQIVLHGLIALVPIDSSGQTNEMAALLLDGRTPPPHECITPHHPLLKFRVAPLAACRAVPGCSVNGLFCECGEGALAGRQITLAIEPSPVPPLQSLPKSPANSLPSTKTEAVQFGYVANLAQVISGFQLEPSFLDPKSPPASLFARMDVPFDSLLACRLYSLIDDGKKNAHSMSFRKLGTTSALGEAHQALAQMVIAHLDVPDPGGSGPQTVTIHLTNFDGTDDRAIPVDPTVDGFRIDLTNETDHLMPGQACDDGIARHFALYYELAKTATPWDDRQVPHMKFTRFVNADDPNDPNSVANPACVLPDLAVMDRPACPMASYYP